MATVNPNNLYSGGQVVLDSTPYRIDYQRQQAKRAAADEALDKYFQNLPNTINDKGLRDQAATTQNMGFKNIFGGVGNFASMWNGGGGKKKTTDVADDTYDYTGDRTSVYA